MFIAFYVRVYIYKYNVERPKIRELKYHKMKIFKKLSKKIICNFYFKQ